jgi:hypothetical protein
MEIRYLLFISLLIIGIVELVFPMGGNLTYLKYILIGINLIFSLIRISDIKILFLIAILFIYLIIYLFIFQEYQLTLHFIVIQILLVIFLTYLKSFNYYYSKKIINNILFTIAAFSLLKLLVAINFILNLDIYILSEIYQRFGGGSIDVFGYLKIPRITFGPEFIFLIVLLVCKNRFYFNLTIASLMLGMSRIYLLETYLILLIKRNFYLFFLFTGAILTFIFIDRQIEMRNISDSDVRFTQWEIFYQVISHNLFTGSPGAYNKLWNYYATDLGYSGFKSECEGCNFIADLGLINFTYILISPIISVMLLYNIRFKIIYIPFIFLLLASFFNPVFLTFAYITIILTFVISILLDNPSYEK